MNQNESEFEQDLRALRPRPASSALEERIAADLARHELTVVEHVPAAAILRRERPARAPFAGWLSGLGWAFAGAVVACAAIAVSERMQGRALSLAAVAEPAAETFQHAESTEQLLTAEDEGVVIDEEKTPVRQVHYYSVERHVWVNPRTGARMEFEIPREDVRFTPVAMQ